MLLLAIDTSTLTASVALLDGDEVLAERVNQLPGPKGLGMQRDDKRSAASGGASDAASTASVRGKAPSGSAGGGGRREPPMIDAKRGHGSGLQPLINATIAGAQLTPQDLQGIVVGIGPGTFTGLRVGLAAAKGMAIGLGIPLVGISSLAAMARNVADVGIATGLAVPILDARRSEVYAAVYDIENAFAVVVPQQVIAPEAFARQLSQLKRPATCFGTGYLCYHRIMQKTRHWGRFQSSHMRRLEPSQTSQHTPRAVYVGRLGQVRIARGEQDDVAALIPTYMRKSYAEEQKAG